MVAAHELKAPLCLIRQLGLSLQFNEDDHDRHTLCQQLVNVSERAILQVNDLTKVARLEDGLFEMEPVSVRGVCEAVIRDIEPIFGFKRKRIGVIYHNQQKLAVANYDLLYSVIHNFCTNAIRYSDSESTSALLVKDEKNKVRISVRDYGPALPNSIWHDLRHGNLQHPTSIAMRPGSSGLGLYISAKFAEHMRADLGAVRHRDGTSFYIDLPVSRQACLF